MISIRDRGLLYGDGVFRTLCISNGQPQHWPLHYQKLQNDCAALGIVCPDGLSDELAVLVAAHPDAVVKIIVTRGQNIRGYTPAFDVIPAHIWDVTALPVYPSGYENQGVVVRLCELRLGHQPQLAGIKHLNRLENVLAAAELAGTEAQEGLLLDAEGLVIEGVRSNLFLFSQGRLITPSLSRCGVAGVQRDRVMAGAAKLGMPIDVRNVELAELFCADELFLTNSVFGLWPVAQLEQQHWTDFSRTSKIRAVLELK